MLLLDHQPVNVAEGIHEWGPLAIPDGPTELYFELARKTSATPTFWANGVFVNLDSWCSLDGGIEWLQWLGFGSMGGIYRLQRDGSESPASWGRCGLPVGISRIMRVVLTVTGGPLVSQLTVEVT